MKRIIAIGDLHLEGLDAYFPALKGLYLQCEQLTDQLVYAIEEKANNENDCG